MTERVKRIPRKPVRKPRLSVLGALDRRMAASVNMTLREIGEPRKYHWSRLCGFNVRQLKEHIESQFVDGMDWDRFLAGGIDLDHIIPQSWFPYRSSSDLCFKDCWALANYQPLWASENRGKRDRFAGSRKVLDAASPGVTG